MTSATEINAPATRQLMPIGLTVGVYLVVLIGFVVPLLDVPREIRGLFALILMLGLIGLKVPVGIAIMASSIIGLFGVGGWSAVESTLQNVTYRAVQSWSLAVLPMFILMGLLLWRAGATEKLYVAAQHWLSRVPGGLAVTTNFAGAGLAAVSGSTIGITYAVARIGIPEMLRQGYDRRLATGAVLMAGTGGQLIPPSILLVIYAGIANTSVGPQLLAGVIPGVILALAYGVAIIIVATVNPRLAPRAERARSSMREKVRASVAVWPLPVLATIVLGSIFGGYATATEAGAFGAAGSVLIAFWYLSRSDVWRRLGQAILETASATAGIFLLLISAALMSRMLGLSGVSYWLTERLAGLDISRVSLILVLLVMYLALGLVIEPLSMLVLTVPILIPVLEAQDISLLWFGVFVVLLGELAVLTPPVGILSFVVHRVVQDPEVRGDQTISLQDVFVGALWFLPVAVLVLILLIFFPDLAEWLPRVSRS